MALADEEKRSDARGDQGHNHRPRFLYDQNVGLPQSDQERSVVCILATLLSIPSFFFYCL